MILTCVRTGIAQMWQRKRMLWPFYLANVCFGLVIMLPFGFLVDKFVGNSLMRERLGVAMDYDFFFEFMLNNAEGLASVQGVLMVVPLFYWLVALFLSGGALAVFAKDQYTPALFWGGAASNFGAFLRLALLSIPVVIALYCIRYLENLVQWVAFGDDPYEYISFWGAGVRMLLGYFGLILAAIVLDYGRIYLVRSGDGKARRGLWQGIRFAASQPLKTVGLALLFFCAGWVGLLIYYLLATALTPPHWLVVVSLLVLQQVFILFRMALRLSAYAGQMHMYRTLSD